MKLSMLEAHMFANSALLGDGVRVWIREQRKEIKGTTMANLDITRLNLFAQALG